MDEERPSVTAEGAAVMRAIHQTFDGDPKILDDPVSPDLVNAQRDFYKFRLELLDRLPEPTRLRLKAAFRCAVALPKTVSRMHFRKACANTYCWVRDWIPLHIGSLRGPSRFGYLKSIILQLNDGSARG